MTFVPIFIPHNTEPSKCPKCRRNENIVEVCRHCGYEYEESDWTWRDVLITVCIVVVGFWLLITVLYWFFQSGNYYGDKTLVEIIVSQWNWLTKLRIW